MNYKNNISNENLIKSLRQSRELTHDYFENECIKYGINLSLIKASVLVPFLEINSKIHILLTNRSEQLEDHAGQVSFPGGRIDTSDLSPVDTAIRESYEEIGLHPDNIEVLGSLDAYQTGTGFRILPILARINNQTEFEINKEEVDSIFYLPLNFLMNSKNHLSEIKSFKKGNQSYDYNFNVIQYEDNYIWGATAAMLINLYEVLIKEI